MKYPALFAIALLLAGCTHCPKPTQTAFLVVGHRYMILWDSNAFSEYGNFSANQNEFTILDHGPASWYLAEWTAMTEKHKRWINIDHAVIVSERK
jgi:hypothetical protein